MSNMKTNRFLPVLDPMLDSVTESLNEKAAKSLVKLRANPKAQARIAKLAEKCNEGTITEQERNEYEMYIWVGNVVALLQAKARKRLAQTSLARRTTRTRK